MNYTRALHYPHLTINHQVMSGTKGTMTVRVKNRYSVYLFTILTPDGLMKSIENQRRYFKNKMIEDLNRHERAVFRGLLHNINTGAKTAGEIYDFYGTFGINVKEALGSLVGKGLIYESKPHWWNFKRYNVTANGVLSHDKYLKSRRTPN